MKMLKLTAAAALTLVSSAALALEPTTVSVIGITQVGSGSVSTSQNSTMNFVGSYQNGPNVQGNFQQRGVYNSVSGYQTGGATKAIVGQQGVYNTTTFTQRGPSNSGAFTQAGVPGRPGSNFLNVGQFRR
jgi:hypothetical protein